MANQVLIGNFGQGQKTNREAFAIDNDAFPYLYNFYTWRGRVKRKRGTILLGRLRIQGSTATGLNHGTGTLSGGAGNLITSFSSSADASVVPGSVTIVTGGNTYTEPSTPDGTLVGSPAGSGTINYGTGAFTISGGGASNFTATFDTYPNLPVMGLRDFASSTTSAEFPLLLAFDTKNSYQFNQNVTPKKFYNTTFFKKSQVPFQWSGADYKLFWSTNFPATNSTTSGSLWATNNVPGFNFLKGSYDSGSGTNLITFILKNGSANFTTLVVGDQLWFNEWTTGGSTISGLTGEVENADFASIGKYRIKFASAQTAAGIGIAQMLTNTIPGQDGIKWYDGDPTAGTGIPAATGFGWVNFAPPLTSSNTAIDDLPSNLYYLVGALAIVPFKDRLIFFSPWVQTSSGSAIQLQDTAIWSWNGTPYYSSPVPSGQTFDARAYYVDQTGLAGYLSVGTSKPIASVSINEDALIVGFGGLGLKSRFIYTGDDINPFLFFAINSEYPSTSLFSVITMDQGVLDVGNYGICITDQQSSQRIDLQIPDSIFTIQLANNGLNRINATRDFQNEWVYFSYPVNNSSWKFPTQTFLYNYRDQTWAVFYENFTCHGTFRSSTGFTWQTIPFSSWDTWRVPWNSSVGTELSPQTIAGNPQGFVLIKGSGTGEGASGNIADVSNNGGTVQIKSFNHCVESNNPSLGLGDYLLIQGCIGSTYLNGQIGKVLQVIDVDNFTLDIPWQNQTYLGAGTFTRLPQPFLQTKQFQGYWEEGRKTRIGVQKYLMDRTANGQVTVYIYLSTDNQDPWNSGSIVPTTEPNPTNSGLIYSQLMYTCPELANLGLTAANINLQMPTGASQQQIWHRFNTSMIGDTFQIGLTLSEDQMKNLEYAQSEIVLQAMHFSISPGPQLC